DLPLAMVKVNGIGLGFIEIGFYRIKDLGSVRLFVLSRQKPYLLLRTSDDTILIGAGAEKNKKLLEQIQSRERVH
ncbi:MAG: PH domain-containing protein, partial [Coriobacteriia bacterium]